MPPTGRFYAMSPDVLLDLFIQYGYWIIFVGILLDNAGLPLPGELLLMAFGALARTGQMDLGLGSALALLGAVSGDSVGYWVGRLGGSRLLHVFCHVTLGSSQCVRNAVAFYRLRGPAAVVFGRFVMGVRAFLAPLAGSARMPYPRFLAFDVVGATVWAGLFVLAGYRVGWQLPGTEQEYRSGVKLLTLTFGSALLVYLAVKLKKRWRHGSADATVATPVWAPAGFRRRPGRSSGADAPAPPEGSSVGSLSAPRRSRARP